MCSYRLVIPRRRFQFTLRTLLLAITLVAVVVGWLEWKRNRYLVREEACRQIIASGGQVIIEPHAIATCFDIFGSRYSKMFDRVSTIEVTSVSKYVRALGAVPAEEKERMRKIFARYKVDVDLRPIRNLPNVRLLDMSGGLITDDQLEYLVGLKQLTTLNLSGGDITDNGLPLLAQLTSLESLDLSETAVADLACLRTLRKLRVLNS